MASQLLESLRELLEEELDGVTATAEGLRAVADARFAEIVLRIDHDEEAEAEDGMLAVHADLEASKAIPSQDLANDVADRVESIIQLLDEDLAEYLLDVGLGTPAQRARWESRRPGTEEETVD